MTVGGPGERLPVGGATGRAERMRAAMAQRFAPRSLAIADESARHAGHAGVQAGGAAAAAGETHYAVRMVSHAFAGLSRVQRARLVHEALAAEFASGLHALSLALHTPEEQERLG